MIKTVADPEHKFMKFISLTPKSNFNTKVWDKVHTRKLLTKFYIAEEKFIWFTGTPDTKM